jgi:hypothetical protein
MNTKDKQQERLNHIAVAANVYANEVCKNRVLDKYNLSDQELIGLAFFNGAKLADRIPRRGLVEIEDVEDIYCMWLEDDNDNSDFLEYFVNYCKKKGWL